MYIMTNRRYLSWGPARSSVDWSDWLVAERRTCRTREAPDVVIDAVRHAEMDPEHAALDDLMK